MQCLLLVHQIDLEHHKPGQNCELCLHAGNLDSLHVPGSASFLPELFGRFEFESPHTINVVSHIYPAGQARAPPSYLL
jgi:hypothetical protein